MFNEKLSAMKRILLILTFCISAITLNAQRSIDALFSKYAGKDGFVTLTISGNLLKLVDLFDDDTDENIGLKPENISEIRILAQEDTNLKVENFYDLVMKDIDADKYEEFMRIRESDQDVRMMVRTEGNRFKEFLLVAGGEDNVVIQIRGNMTFAEARKFSEKAKKEHGMNMLEK
jgi:hypothetical protein